MPDRIGQQIGNYRLVMLLGEGGSSDVYLGQHLHIQRMQAAIKFLHARLGQNYQRAFLQEAETIASLRHPHIIRILDFGIDRDNTPYLIMEYASRGTLRTRHPKGIIVPPSIVVSYVKQIAEALQYAHDHNLIHRDLKPENLLLGENGEVLLSDFGVAAFVHATNTLQTSAYSGTATYSAPEQILGKPRVQSDEYALGIIVYEWLTGDIPFHGSFPELCSQHLYAPPQPLRQKVPGIPPAVEAVVMRALAKDPHQRFNDVATFAKAFEQACIPPPPPPPPLPPLPIAPSTTRGNTFPQALASPRNILLLALAILVILAGIFAVVGVHQINSQASADATATAVTSMSQMTATTVAKATANAHATATAYANATATAEANPYGGLGTLALSDPLLDPSRNIWDVGPNSTGGDCEFRGNAYHASQSNTNYIQICYEPNDYSNFAIEVQMTIVKGDCGGIEFRSNKNTGKSYDFKVCQNGSYELVLYVDSNHSNTLISSSSSAIHTGLNASNVIAVVANGSTLDLYVNMQKIGGISDSTYSQGIIGLLAIPINKPTEVVYSNARVWKY